MFLAGLSRSLWPLQQSCEHLAVLSEILTLLIVRRMPPFVLHPDLLLLSGSGMGQLHWPVEKHGGEDEDDVDYGQDEAYQTNLESYMFLKAYKRVWDMVLWLVRDQGAWLVRDIGLWLVRDWTFSWCLTSQISHIFISLWLVRGPIFLRASD